METAELRSHAITHPISPPSVSPMDQQKQFLASVHCLRTAYVTVPLPSPHLFPLGSVNSLFVTGGCVKPCHCQLALTLAAAPCPTNFAFFGPTKKNMW